MIDDWHLDKLIKSRKEGLYWDFKQEMYAFNDPSESKRKHARNGFVKDIICLHNGNRNCERFAYIIIGIEDETMRVVGMPEAFDEQQLRDWIADKIKPLPQLRFYKLDYLGKPLGIIEIARNSPSPLVAAQDIWKNTHGKPKAELLKGDIWHRLGSFNHKAETVWERYRIKSSFPLLRFCIIRSGSRLAGLAFIIWFLCWLFQNS